MAKSTCTTRELLTVQFQSSVSSRVLGPSTFLSIPFSDTPNLFSSLKMRDKIHTIYSNRQNCSSVYILTLIFLGSKLEEKDSVPNDSKHSLTSICFQFSHACCFDLLKECNFSNESEPVFIFHLCS